MGAIPIGERSEHRAEHGGEADDRHHDTGGCDVARDLADIRRDEQGDERGEAGADRDVRIIHHSNRRLDPA